MLKLLISSLLLSIALGGCSESNENLLIKDEWVLFFNIDGAGENSKTEYYFLEDSAIVLNFVNPNKLYITEQKNKTSELKWRFENNEEKAILFQLEDTQYSFQIRKLDEDELDIWMFQENSERMTIQRFLHPNDKRWERSKIEQLKLWER